MLKNTAYKLNVDKELRVAYFGGSITEGAGASDRATTSYRAKTTAWLKEKYPEADITEIYAAIGGTGTGLGMFRQRRDVLAHKPDLLFIEFATNDFGDKYERVLPQIESMLRQLRRESPLLDVVVLISTAQMVIEHLEAGGTFESRQAHIDAAKHYGAPTIELGTYLYDHVRAEGVPYEAYAPDTLHPGDNGYEVITECLVSELEKMLDVDVNGLSMTSYELPEVITDLSSENGDIIDACNLEELELNGFEYVVEKNDRFEGFLQSQKARDSFSFSFVGKGVGLYRVGGDNGSDLWVSVDGGEPTMLESPDHYDRSFLQMNAALVTKSLEYGRHRVTVTVTEMDEPLVRIGGIYIC